MFSKSKIWVYNNYVFLTDESASNRKDSVFPLCYENTYLSKNLDVKQGDLVLDLCTGCGILGISASQKAEYVLGTDINQRCIEFAKFNAKLNGVDHKVDFYCGDLFEPVKGLKFDLIVTNPPFETVPENFEYYLHSNGGKNGTKIIEQILDNIRDYMYPDGKFQMICWLSEKNVSLLNKIRNIFEAKDVKIKFIKKFTSSEIQKYQKDKFALFEKNKNVGCISANEFVYLTFIHAR
jgi:HemK-related putative methylase